MLSLFQQLVNVFYLFAVITELLSFFICFGWRQNTNYCETFQRDVFSQLQRVTFLQYGVENVVRNDVQVLHYHLEKNTATITRITLCHFFCVMSKYFVNDKLAVVLIGCLIFLCRREFTSVVSFTIGPGIFLKAMWFCYMVNTDGALSTILKYCEGVIPRCEHFVWPRYHGHELVVGHCRHSFGFRQAYTFWWMANIYILCCFDCRHWSDFSVAEAFVAVLCGCLWFFHVSSRSLQAPE